MNSDSIMVSIIVPIYNAEPYLQQCIDSLLQQTYCNLQIILVDDGSTDYSGSICDAYRDTDTRVNVIHKENGGLSSAREAGMNAVSGQFVMIVDSDDWIDSDTVERCVSAVTEDLEVECVLFAYAKETGNTTIPMQLMDNSEIFEGEAARDKIHRRLFGLAPEELNHPERMENIVSCCMKMYRVDLAKKGRYFDTKEVGACEDGLFNMYALANCEKAVYLDIPFYHYRKHQGSLVSSYKPNLTQQWDRLFSIMQEYIQTENLGERYQVSLNNRIALSITAIALNKFGDVSTSVFGMIRYIRQYLSGERYRYAIKNMDMRTLPFLWKVLLWSCRHRCAAFVYLGMVAIKILRQKGK